MTTEDRLAELKKTVCNLGGEGTFQKQWYLEHEIGTELAELLVAKAVVLGPTDHVLPHARPSDCHMASFEAAKSLYGHVWTGFALNDGIWRVHSWVMKGDLILEATPVRREKHVGIKIDTDEEFCIWWPALRPVFDVANAMLKEQEQSPPKSDVEPTT